MCVYIYSLSLAQMQHKIRSSMPKVTCNNNFRSPAKIFISSTIGLGPFFYFIPNIFLLFLLRMKPTHFFLLHVIDFLRIYG